jgi:tetratricopeptide (TPR) repeat protein
MAVELRLRSVETGQLLICLDEAGQLRSLPPRNVTIPAAAESLSCRGKRLFAALFADPEARRLFDAFRNREKAGRVLAIESHDPLLLGQPWELLHEPNGSPLLHDTPPVSFRRRHVAAAEGKPACDFVPKDRLDLLFVASRPADASFTDPRLMARAVLEAIETEAPGCISVGILRPPTLIDFMMRFELPEFSPVHILHIDGSIIRENGESRLVFENRDGTANAAATTGMARTLTWKNTGLVILSATETPPPGAENPMPGAATALFEAGVPAVLTLNRPAPAATLRSFFGAFYGGLACSETVGTAFDQACHAVRLTAETGTPLSAQDEFLPMLYQFGGETRLLSGATLSGATLPAAEASPSRDYESGLPLPPETGFLGRGREIRQIERWFTDGVRRIVLNGPGGQGKTALAAEAADWLQRTRMFGRVCFISFATFRGADPLGHAVAALANALDETLFNAKAVTAALERRPVLVVLDNFEAIETGPLQSLIRDESLKEALDAAAGWSEAGASRVLITTSGTRLRSQLRHPKWNPEVSESCRDLPLQGLAEADAIALSQAISVPPPDPSRTLPAREELRGLFIRVGFHPLAVSILSREAKTRSIAELAARLDALLIENEGDPLLAAVTLAVEKCGAKPAGMLPCLGVFQGGAFEDAVIGICDFEAEAWQILRRALEQAGIVRAESLPGIDTPFLRFHPALAPALWSKLALTERSRLAARHRRHYRERVGVLRRQDDAEVVVTRRIVRRELPNLLTAAHGVSADDPFSAEEFVHELGYFLEAFGLERDWDVIQERQLALSGGVLSQMWFHTWIAMAERLLREGRAEEADAAFNEILERFGGTLSHNRCATLLNLTRSLQAQKRTSEAEALIRQALAEIEQLEMTPSLRRLLCTIQVDLGDLLQQQNRFREARAAYEAAFANAETLGDDRGIAITLGQLATIASLEGDHAAAEERYRQALDGFIKCGDSHSEASVRHQIGRLFCKTERWQEAEESLREAERLWEKLGDRRGLGMTRDLLEEVMKRIDRLDEAEESCGKALEAGQSASDPLAAGRRLDRLAKLLLQRPGELGEARRHAEQALALKQRLDPVAGEIWTTYTILARIAAKEGNEGEARRFRREARKAFAGTMAEHRMLRREALILITLVVAGQSPSMLGTLEKGCGLLGTRECDWTGLLAAMRRIAEGERDPESLCDPLDHEESSIIRIVLRGIADRSALDPYHPDAPDDLPPPVVD